jgi:hypothetical protein
MLVNLDLLDVHQLDKFPPPTLNFLLYNPTAIARSANINIPLAKQRTARFTVNGKPSDATVQLSKQSFVLLMVEF